MFSRNFPIILWAVICVAIWAWVARDLMTVIACLIATVPYTVYLISHRSRYSH